ncbi:hypothetical protein I6I93_02035 [Peptoniphilus harei]|uniref:Diaminopimelate epimerase n=2 Tax=Peptoniphilus harei TaxID=54005 RepID=A0A2X1X023_9FIRM|nr:hypothetical protein [Peptoniphilus harei]QQT91392.1 hypothetical protein I6I93_02035 [Peptoniphilus harei]SPY31876.1 Uncharacterised protein [Peptoniphilus harei]SPY31881.1 Uncharacterised protein [Peptoniphilus harei]SPY36218.1 Uncharacterised protein [Peptoniphilus harei]SPY49052.1 Uncharacterised protein [Peptoniphilus harei]
MKKTFNYFRANPCGNITGFVVAPVYPGYRKAYTDCIMEQIDKDVEQVGFISPAYEGAPLRMDMMGGEFCANATRAYGLYSASFYDTDGLVDIEVYVSGHEGTTDVIADVKNQKAYVALDAPIGREKLTIDGKDCTLIKLPGISHLVVEEEEDKEFVDKALEVLKKDHKDEAYGVLFFNKEKLEMIPYVYVEGSETLFREGSCGSGTIAVVNYLEDDIAKLDEDYKISIKNPAGELEVFVYEFEDGKKFCVGGKVELSEVEKKSIEIPQDVALAVIAEHDKIVEEHKKKMAEEESEKSVDESDLTDEELKIMREKFGFD